VYREPALPGDSVLSPLDLGIEKLFDSPTLQAYEVIVVPAFIELEHRLAAFEMVTDEQAGLRELRQDAIHGCKADIHVFREQKPVNILGGEMPFLAGFEEIEDFESRQRGLEPHALQVARCSHRLEIPYLHGNIVAAFALALQLRRSSSQR
jgi:hypothetical protein